MEPEAIAVKLIGSGTRFHDKDGSSCRTVLRLVIARDHLQLIHHLRRLGIVVGRLEDSAAAIASGRRSPVIDGISSAPLSDIEVSSVQALTGRGPHPMQPR